MSLSSCGEDRLGFVHDVDVDRHLARRRRRGRGRLGRSGSGVGARIERRDRRRGRASGVGASAWVGGRDPRLPDRHDAAADRGGGPLMNRSTRASRRSKRSPAPNVSVATRSVPEHASATAASARGAARCGGADDDWRCWRGTDMARTSPDRSASTGRDGTADAALRRRHDAAGDSLSQVADPGLAARSFGTGRASVPPSAHARRLRPVPEAHRGPLRAQPADPRPHRPARQRPRGRRPPDDQPPRTGVRGDARADPRRA